VPDGGGEELQPIEEYRKRLGARLEVIAARERRHVLIGYLKVAVIAGLIALIWIYFARHPFRGYWILLPVALYAILAVLHERVIQARSHAETAADIYRRGIARIEDRWSGAGATGERFIDAKHVYADDLDVFGSGSLFQLLCTARLPMGEKRLADWLRNPSTMEIAIERQGLIAELRPKLDLREDLAVTGQDLQARLDPESLIAWCESPAVLGGTVLRVVAAACATCAAACFVYFVHTFNLMPFLVVLVAEGLLFRGLRKHAREMTAGVDCNSEGVVLFSRILERLEREQFAAPSLQRMVASLEGASEPAFRSLRRFARIVNWIDALGSLIVRIIDVPLLYSVQIGLAAEAWRRRCGQRMRVWVDAAAEAEALLSLATYTFEHPADSFPEFLDSTGSPAVFSGEQLGHPLIEAARCVRNDVELDAATRVLLVSGSNMSGKSTLLRTVGINAILAMAGAPVHAKRLKLSPVALGTRLRSTDSLQEGRSTFYTELLRIRQVVEMTKGSAPVLFLFDELLDGTNSHDRQIGAENLIRVLLEKKAMGIVTTHDLALTELPAILGDVVRNAHFQDYVEGGQMRFDYKLRDGVVTKSNALELMRLAGLDV
jgi:MutS domain V